MHKLSQAHENTALHERRNFLSYQHYSFLLMQIADIQLLMRIFNRCWEFLINCLHVRNNISSVKYKEKDFHETTIPITTHGRGKLQFERLLHCICGRMQDEDFLYYLQLTRTMNWTLWGVEPATCLGLLVGYSRSQWGYPMVIWWWLYSNTCRQLFHFIV